jgi:hypothetical protein
MEQGEVRHVDQRGNASDDPLRAIQVAGTSQNSRQSRPCRWLSEILIVRQHG